jgi:hypothetical protein
MRETPMKMPKFRRGREVSRKVDQKCARSSLLTALRSAISFDRSGIEGVDGRGRGT